MGNKRIVTTILGCTSLLGSMTSADGYGPRTGQPHPSFTLPGVTDNKPIALSQFRGKKVLLIHFASW